MRMLSDLVTRRVFACSISWIRDALRLLCFHIGDSIA